MRLGTLFLNLVFTVLYFAFTANAVSAQALTDSTHTQASDLPTINDTATDTVAVEIYQDDPVLAALDSLWKDERMHWQDFDGDTVCQNVYNFPYGFIPEYNDSILMARLEVLNKATPLDLEYNRFVKGFISLYVDRQRELTSRILGLAELYYPLFEEKLDLFDIPIELKHLAVVESALNSKARSRVGASGLWQFMYSTGRLYGLEVDSYIDDRSDVYKSTVAACRYMRYLYKIYGDWNMVLAAYNSGPGNVNKAIRRSGGKKNYWEIRQFLPRETRSYVPAFIAVNYVMNYAAEHNIYASKPEFLYSEIDTIHVCRKLTFDQISHFTGVTVAQLELLNPSLKLNIVPESPKCRTLYLPTEAIGVFLAHEDSIYNYRQDAPQAVNGYITEEVTTIYTVRKGDALGLIAQRHGVSLSDLRTWNRISGNNIHPGQKLKIHQTVKTKVGEETLAKNEKESQAPTTPATEKKNTEIIYHIVQPGDTLWDIAKKYPGVSLQELKSLNSNINHSKLKPGQKIKIPPTT